MDKVSRSIKRVKELAKYAEKYLPHWNTDKEPMFYSLLSAKYFDYHGDDGIKAMLGCIQFLIEHNSESDIAPTMAHDFNGMGDELLLPRSSGYLKYYKKKQEEWR